MKLLMPMFLGAVVAGGFTSGFSVFLKYSVDLTPAYVRGCYDRSYNLYKRDSDGRYLIRSREGYGYDRNDLVSRDANLDEVCPKYPPPAPPVKQSSVDPSGLVEPTTVTLSNGTQQRCSRSAAGFVCYTEMPQ